MKHKIHRILLFVAIAVMAAFTLVPPAHQVPETNRFVPAVVYQKPPVGTLTLSTLAAGVTKGENICVPIIASGFEQILTMQYSMFWDANVLKFKEIKNFGLDGMDKRNFGTHVLDKGILTFSWYDQALRGMTKADGFTLYELCFEAIGEIGSETKVDFSSNPTIVEISNASSVFLDLRSNAGSIIIE